MAEETQIGIRVQAHLDEAAQAMGRLEREMRQLDGAATRAQRGWNRAAKSIKDFAYAGLFANTATSALLRVGSAVGRLPGAIVEAGVAAERLEKRFRFAFDSAAEGAQQLDFVRSEAQRLGIDFAASAQAFSDFAAATSGTAIEGAATREVFTAVAEAARAQDPSVRIRSARMPMPTATPAATTPATRRPHTDPMIAPPIISGMVELSENGGGSSGGSRSSRQPPGQPSLYPKRHSRGQSRGGYSIFMSGV